MTTTALTQEMTSVAVTGPRQLSTLTSPIPELGPTDVLVHVAYCGICGSDLPRYFDGAVHAFPQVLGHEFSGVIRAVGSQVTERTVGERVAVAPLVPCHTCPQCQGGHPSLCPRYSFVGSRQQGALAQYVAVPDVNAVPVGDLDLRLAALIEPLTVAIHAIDRVPFAPGEPVTVLGCGVIGLMAVIALRDRGAGEISVVDVNPWVLEMAQRFGATHAINALEDDAVARVRAAGAPRSTVETAGAAATRRQSLQVAAKNGGVVYVGTPSSDLTLDADDFEQVLRKELTLRGSWMSYSAPFPGAEWRDAARILSTAAADPGQIITHTFPLDQVAQGFEAMRDPAAQRLKVMFTIAGQEA